MNGELGTAIREWVAERVSADLDALRFSHIKGGRSNLTVAVARPPGGPQWVVRTPPTGPHLPTAHDVGREFRAISALANSPVPVPPPVGFLEEAAGGPAYLMRFVPGTSLSGAHDLREKPALYRKTALVSAGETLAAIHAVDLEQVGLTRHGRGESYVERQLGRWFEQFKATPSPVSDSVPETYALLMARIPPQVRVTLVHGDFHFANVRLDPGGHVTAVFDWELSTLGDPLADLGTFIAYLDGDIWDYSYSDDPTQSPAQSELQMILDAYTGTTGWTADALDFYVAAAHWKIACIGEGVLVRAAAAQDGDLDDIEFMRELTIGHARAAQQILAGTADQDDASSRLR